MSMGSTAKLSILSEGSNSQFIRGKHMNIAQLPCHEYIRRCLPMEIMEITITSVAMVGNWQAVAAAQDQGIEKTRKQDAEGTQKPKCYKSTLGHIRNPFTMARCLNLHLE